METEPSTPLTPASASGSRPTASEQSAVRRRRSGSVTSAPRSKTGSATAHRAQQVVADDGKTAVGVADERQAGRAFAACRRRGKCF